MLCCAVLCRLLCFKCLNYLVTSSLVRNKAAASNPSVVAWLDKVVKPVLTSTRKGGVQVQDQQVCIVECAVVCSNRSEMKTMEPQRSMGHLCLCAACYD
jgi:hypothetical protein